MPPLVKIITATLVFGSLEVGIFTFLAYAALGQMAASAFGSGITTNEILNVVIFLLNLGLLVLCPFICPVVAFFLRSTIVALTPNTNTQFFIFVAMSVFPVVLFFGLVQLAITK